MIINVFVRAGSRRALFESDGRTKKAFALLVSLFVSGERTSLIRLSEKPAIDEVPKVIAMENSQFPRRQWTIPGGRYYTPTAVALCRAIEYPAKLSSDIVFTPMAVTRSRR